MCLIKGGRLCEYDEGLVPEMRDFYRIAEVWSSYFAANPILGDTNMQGYHSYNPNDKVCHGAPVFAGVCARRVPECSEENFNKLRVVALRASITCWTTPGDPIHFHSYQV